jgi:hypothetical protein
MNYGPADFSFKLVLKKKIQSTIFTLSAPIFRTKASSFQDPVGVQSWIGKGSMLCCAFTEIQAGRASLR